MPAAAPAATAVASGQASSCGTAPAAGQSRHPATHVPRDRSVHDSHRTQAWCEAPAWRRRPAAHPDRRPTHFAERLVPDGRRSAAVRSAARTCAASSWRPAPGWKRHQITRPGAWEAHSRANAVFPNPAPATISVNLAWYGCWMRSIRRWRRTCSSGRGSSPDWCDRDRDRETWSSSASIRAGFCSVIPDLPLR